MTCTTSCNHQSKFQSFVLLLSIYSEKTEAQRGTETAQSHSAIGVGPGFELKKLLFNEYRVSEWGD